jgi:tRNA A37 N6-isopentenylltransferase MiaA
VLPTARDPLLDIVDLHGAHDFRHTFATWLEDAGIPARVIDELMGHEATSRGGQQRGSAMGALYRHTTPEMAGRIATAIEQRLTVVLEVAEQTPRPTQPAQRRKCSSNHVPRFWQISGKWRSERE